VCDDPLVKKYEPLREHLASMPADIASVTMSFDEVEDIVGGLPPSARKFRQWWANDSKVEARAWRAAGWHVDGRGLDVDAG
jgi:hypothetical protein